MLAEAVDKHCDSDLFTQRYHSLYHIIKNVQKFGTLSVLYGGYDHLNLHMKQTYRRILQRRQTRTIAAANVVKRNYKRALLYGKEKIGVSLRQEDKNMAMAERSGPYL